MRLVWLVLGWTMVEIGLFATIGGQIGVLATWGVALGSALGGIWMIRRQKRNLLGDMLSDLQSLRAGVNTAAHSALITLAGILLILPGFFTDFVGLVLLIPWVQNWIIGELSRRATTAALNGGLNAMRNRHHEPTDEVIDAEAVKETPPPIASHKP